MALTPDTGEETTTAMPYPYYRDPDQQPYQPASQHNTPYIVPASRPAPDLRNTGDLLMEQLTLVEHIRREQAEFQARTLPFWGRYTANQQEMQARRLARQRAAEDARRAQEDRFPYVGPPRTVRPHRVYSHPLPVDQVQTDRLPPLGRDG